MNDVLGRLAAEGVALRLEGVDRRAAASGELASAVRAWGLSGVALHPAAVAAGVRDGGAYTAQLRDLALRGVGGADGVRHLLAHDARWACEAVLPVFEGDGRGSGCAALPVPPWWTAEPGRLLAEARALRWEVDRPNLLLDVAADPLAARTAEDLLAEGIGVQVSGAAVSDVARAAGAFLNGLERARAAGHRLAGLRCVVSVPLPPLGAAFAGVLPTASAGAGARDPVLACARFAYHEYEEGLAGPRWDSLAADGARPWELSWSLAGAGGEGAAAGASGAELLVGWGTSVGGGVRELAAFLEHGVAVPENLSGELAAARRTEAWAEGLGVDLRGVAAGSARRRRAAERAAWRVLYTAVSDSLRSFGTDRRERPTGIAERKSE